MHQLNFKSFHFHCTQLYSISFLYFPLLSSLLVVFAWNSYIHGCHILNALELLMHRKMHLSFVSFKMYPTLLYQCIQTIFYRNHMQFQTFSFSTFFPNGNVFIHLTICTQYEYRKFLKMQNEGKVGTKKLTEMIISYLFRLNLNSNWNFNWIENSDILPFSLATVYTVSQSFIFINEFCKWIKTTPMLLMLRVAHWNTFLLMNKWNFNLKMISILKTVFFFLCLRECVQCSSDGSCNSFAVLWIHYIVI